MYVQSKINCGLIYKPQRIRVPDLNEDPDEVLGEMTSYRNRFKWNKNLSIQKLHTFSASCISLCTSLKKSESLAPL